MRYLNLLILFALLTGAYGQQRKFPTYNGNEVAELIDLPIIDQVGTIRRVSENGLDYICVVNNNLYFDAQWMPWDGTAIIPPTTGTGTSTIYVKYWANATVLQAGPSDFVGQIQIANDGAVSLFSTLASTHPDVFIANDSVNIKALLVNGATTLNSLAVANATGTGTLNVTGNATLNTASVTGDITIGGNVIAAGMGRFSSVFFLGTTASNPAIIPTGTDVGIRLGDNSAFTTIQSLYDRWGSGSPEGAVAAPVGSVYHNSTGGANTALWRKETGTGNTGWVPDTAPGAPSSTFSTITVTGLATLNSATIQTTLGVTGATSLSTLTTSGLATLNSAGIGTTLSVGGATSLSTLSTSGLATLNGLNVTTGSTLASASITGTLSTGGLATLNALTVTNASTLATLSTSGLATLNSASITGVLSTGGLATLNSLSVTGATTLSVPLPTTSGGTGSGSTSPGNTFYFGTNATGTKGFYALTGASIGLGTMASQNANAVAITGGTMSGVTITGGSIPNTSVTGLGTMSTQNANAIAITGGTITGITDLAVADGGTGASTLSGYVKGNGTLAMTGSASIPNTDVTGLGTMSTQGAGAVAITGGAINGTTIGATTPSTGAFTTLSTSGLSTLNSLTVTGATNLSTLNTSGLATVSSASVTGHIGIGAAPDPWAWARTGTTAVPNLGLVWAGYFSNSGSLARTVVDGSSSSGYEIAEGGVRQWAILSQGGVFNLIYTPNANALMLAVDGAKISTAYPLVTQFDKYGAGSPEGVVTAPIGSIYHNSTGSTNTTLYRKESGTGATGWIAVVQPAGAAVLPMSELLCQTTYSSGAAITAQLKACADDTGTANVSTQADGTLNYVKTMTTWAAGNSAGMMDVGSAPAVLTWYYMFAIRNVSTGARDFLCSTSATAPTMPSGFTLKRRILAFITDTGPNIRSFQNYGDLVIFDPPYAESSSAFVVGSPAVLKNVMAPPIAGTVARITASIQDTNLVGYLYVSSPQSIDIAASSTAFSVRFGTSTTLATAGSVMDIPTSTSQVRMRSGTAAGSNCFMITLGFIDRRGKDF